MSEWWTYSPHDFLLFSSRTYYRLFELHNAALWPAHIPAIILAIILVLLLASRWRHRSLAAAIVLTACWLWVAWSFLLDRYATINWAAPWFAGLFALEAALLLAVGLLGGSRLSGEPWGPGEIAFFTAALVAQPVVGLLMDRPWRQAEIFAIAPDPTAFATLALVMLAPRRSRWLLMPIPILWCAISGATLWAMGAPEAVLPVIAAILAVNSGLWCPSKMRRETDR